MEWMDYIDDPDAQAPHGLHIRARMEYMLDNFLYHCDDVVML